MPSYRGSWLRRCVECGRKYKPQKPMGFERHKIYLDAKGEVIPRCGTTVCSAPQHLRDAFIIANMERALMGAGNRDKGQI